MSSEKRDLEREDRLFERLLAPSLAPEPTAEQLDRWEKLFAEELTAAGRRRRQRGVAAAAAACAAAVALAVMLIPQSAPAPGERVAQVVKAFGESVARRGGDAVHALTEDSDVRAGDLLESGPRSGLGLVYRAADVRLDAGTRVAFLADRLKLEQGTLYVDARGPDGSARAGAVRIETPLGTFTHMGTQFLVTVAAGQVSGVVREGTIVLRQGRQEKRLAASPDRARRLVVDPSGTLAESDVSPSGALWAWTLRSSPGIVVAGRSVEDVLQWVTRERGQRLNYADAAAQRLARETRLSGGAARMTVEDAVTTVARTTRLRIDDSDGEVLRVALQSESDQHAH